MRWLPKGTHDWRRFITPDELFALLRGAGLAPVDRKGFVFDPLDWSWRLSDRDLSVNYVTASVRPGISARIDPADLRALDGDPGHQALLAEDEGDDGIAQRARVHVDTDAFVDQRHVGVGADLEALGRVRTSSASSVMKNMTWEKDWAPICKPNEAEAML